MDRAKLIVLIKEPEALRGLDRLIECARRVLDREMREPVHEPAPKPLARTA